MRAVDGVLSRKLRQAVRKDIRDHPFLVIFALTLAAISIWFLGWVALSAAPVARSATMTAIPKRINPVELLPSLPNPAKPTHLTIPAINLDAAIEEVGLTKRGAMAAPTDTNATGWFNLGYLPGEIGNAVITGHVDTLWLQPAVFANLEDLTVGDELNVTDANGNVFTFKVRQLATYNVNELPLTEIFGPAPVPQLNLITCSGKWSWKLGTYLERTVVYTSLK